MEEMNGDRVSEIVFVHKETGMFTLSGEGANAIQINIEQGVNYEVKFQKRGAEQSKSVSNFKL